MNKKIWVLGALVLFGAGLLTPPIQADFIQCPGNADCFGTENSDVANGTDNSELIDVGLGDDVAFGNGGDDFMIGEGGQDLLFGGPGSDELFGVSGNDLLLPGPDREGFGQRAEGFSGDDVFVVFAGEISQCLFIDGDAGHDEVNLIGFGPFSAVFPFGQAGFVEGAIVVTDPIAGGQIYIHVDEPNDDGVEVINGLPSPNVTLLIGDPPAVVLECLLSVPSE